MEDAIAATDAEWRVAVWNRAAQHMYGWSAADTLGHRDSEVPPLALSAQERSAMRQATRTDGRWRGERLARHQDGSPLEVELSVIAVHDAPGSVAGFLSVHRSLTAASAGEHSSIQARLQDAREGERRRIARDLHDGALRELTDALAVEALGLASSPDDAHEEQWATRIEALARITQHLRGSIYDLRLGSGDERAFAGMLAEMVAIQAAMAVECRVELVGAKAIPTGSLGDRGIETLRIVREAITNARRHSGAGTIRIDAAESSQGVLDLRISDDGRWPDFNLAVADPGSAGIVSMTERAHLLGARLRIERGPEGGTVVSVHLALA
jgi:two-component system sensor histidine kinase UhpB